MRLYENDVTLRRLVISVEPDARDAWHVELKKNELTRQPITIGGVIKKLRKKKNFWCGWGMGENTKGARVY